MAMGFSRRSRRIPGGYAPSVRPDRPRTLRARRRHWSAGTHAQPPPRPRLGQPRTSCAPAQRFPRGRCGVSRCVARTGVVGHVPAGVNAALAVSGYGPSDLDSAYNVPTTLGSGKTVAIVDAYDDPNAASDLSTYRSNFGLPACTTANGCFTKVNQNGAASPLPAANTGWSSEIMLDLEMVSAICPQCHILLVEASSPTTANLGTAVDTAVSKGAVAVSNSYGGSESSNEASYDTSYYKHPGVAIVASSGDGGYTREYPAASPYVTAVGGTNLTRTSNSRGWTESVWSTSSSEGAGSGCSAYEAKPSFQTDTGCSRRTIADVSAVADPATGVAVYDSYGSGGWTVFGGTSVASPIIGAMYALANSPAPSAFPNSYPYADPGALYDVTTGHTATCSPAYLCTGEVGYDGPTGLGTPNGAAAFGPGSTGQSDFSVSVNPTNVSVAAGSNATGHCLDRGHLRQLGVCLAERERPAERRDGVVLALLGQLRVVVNPDVHGVVLGGGRQLQHHDHRDRLYRLAYRDAHAQRDGGNGERLLAVGQSNLGIGHGRIRDDRNGLHRGHLRVGADGLARCDRPADGCDGVVLAGVGHGRFFVHADDLDLELDGGRHLHPHDHGNRLVGVTHDVVRADREGGGHVYRGPEDHESGLRVRVDRLDRDRGRDRAVRLVRRAHALRHLGCLARRLRHVAHRHAVAVHHDPERL